MSEKSRKLLQNLCLILFSLCITAVLAEVLLRAILPAPIIWKYPQELYLADPEIGHWLMANQITYTHDEVVCTNSIGIRDSEYDPEPSPGMIRVLALGDSQTFGNGLEQSETWPKQLEQLLNDKNYGRKFEVLNGGLPGSDTWQHEIILRRLLSRYHPDAVILAFYVNDIVKKPEVKINSQHSVRNPFKDRLVYFFKQSALLLVLKSSWDTAQQIWSPSEGFLLQNLIVQGERNTEIDERWRQVHQALSKMKRMTDEEDIPFFVVSLPRRDHVAGNIPFERYDQHLKMILDNINIPLITVIKPLRQSYFEHGKALFIPWDGHNSKVANRVIAGEIADQLLEYGGL